MQYRGQLAAQDALVRHGRTPTTTATRGGRRPAPAGAEVERDVVIAARRRGEVSPEAADEVLDDVETRAFRDTD